tara:strand:- start:305 stop:547 length:243 start_codon:yes stop_codon:yes gene_type:complete
MNNITESSCQRTQQLCMDSQLGLYQRLQQWSKLQLLKARIRRERRQLQEMPAAMLRDMGITPEQAQAEAKRSDIPVFRLG